MAGNFNQSAKRGAWLPFAAPDISDAEIQAVVKVLRSGWLTTGPLTKEFESMFSTRVGCKYAVALNSGTAALHLALDAVGLSAGDEVIVPDFTFTATAEVVRYFGAKLVLVDVKPEDLTIDVAAAEQAITGRTRAIIGVDIGGQSCDWHHLGALAQQYGLRLIDDAAHALPSTFKGRVIGEWADLTAFSFYATKPLTTGEGGMLVTNNAAWADRARAMSLHGISGGAWERSGAEASWYYEVLAPGFKYNMTDIAAALGLAQLERLDEMTVCRERIASTYSESFSDLAEVEPPTVGPDRTSAWHLYLLRLNLDFLQCDRASFIRQLAAENIGASVHFIPLHLHPHYRDSYGYHPGAFPISYREYLRVVSLPIYSRMTEQDVLDVTSAVRRIVERNSLERLPIHRAVR